MPAPRLPRIVDRLHVDAAAEHARLVAGLMAPAAAIAPKYFYDELGCALYGAICQLDEYYPTRTERAIFDTHRRAIADVLGPVDTLVDLGAGDCRKAEGWLPALWPARYLAVDIARGALESALARLAPDWPDVELTGLVTDFSQSLAIPAELLPGRCAVFYPGSSIGNFSPDEAVRFLRDVRAVTTPVGGALLIGVDAKKDKARLDAAYDDALGVTAAFNLNVLRHVNRLLGSDFNVVDWRHSGVYDADAGCIAMHLEARRAVAVRIDGQTRRFAAGERIHTEHSWKYAQDEFEALLRTAGFADVCCWSDEAGAFWVFVAR